jgi:hypothetical protein
LNSRECYDENNDKKGMSPTMQLKKKASGKEAALQYMSGDIILEKLIGLRYAVSISVLELSGTGMVFYPFVF